MTHNPFIPYQIPRGKMLVGRSHEVVRVASNLTSLSPVPHLVIGGRQSGKTSFLLALAERLHVASDRLAAQILPVYVDLNEYAPHDEAMFYRACLLGMWKAISPGTWSGRFPGHRQPCCQVFRRVTCLRGGASRIRRSAASRLGEMAPETTYRPDSILG